MFRLSKPRTPNVIADNRKKVIAIPLWPSLDPIKNAKSMTERVAIRSGVYMFINIMLFSELFGIKNLVK